MASICIERRSSATSRSYWVCGFNQNCADTPKYLPSRSAVSAVTAGSVGEAPASGSGSQEVVCSHGADAQEEETEGGRQGRCRGAFRQRPTEEPSHLLPRHPTSLRQKLQKRRGSGSIVKFWLVSENSVAAPLTTSGAIMGS